jgi:hypothetical protein
MKAGIFFVLCAALVAGGVSVRADDTPEQAAARAALEQKLYQLDHPNGQPSLDTNTATIQTQPAESRANVTNTTSATVAPAMEAPATIAPAKPAPAPTIPAGAVSAPALPNANTPAQTAALAAMNKMMYELNHSAVQPAEANAAALVTESPTAEAPAAVAPAFSPVTVAPVSAAPAVVTPAASADAAPVAAPRPAAVPAPRLHPAKLPLSSPGQARPANELVTTTGTIYKNVEVERVEPDGIVISYTPVNGGWAMAKVYFRDLPAKIRRQYGK